MKTPNYQIKREQVFIGRVVKPTSRNQIVLENGKLSIYQFTPYRSILFTLNEKKLADDLLYNSPEYPVLDFSSNGSCFNAEIVIQEAYNLEPLLTFFQFPNTLTLEQIIMLRKHFFDGTWGFRNCHLFGYREVLPEDWEYVKNGQYVKDSEELKKLHQKERSLQRKGHRVFEETNDATLPADMMFLFNELGDHSVLDVLQGFEKRRNAFIPHEEEGQIKKLRL